MNDHGPQSSPARVGWAGILAPGRFLALRAVVWGILYFEVLVNAHRMARLAAASFGPYGTGPLAIIPYGFATLVSLLLYVMAAYLIERRAPLELGRTRLVPEFAAGAVLGALLFSILMAVLVTAGAYVLTGPTAAPVWRQLAIALESGVREELLFRGVVLRLLWTAFGMRSALVVSSALFGLAHLINPDADILAVLGIFAAGLLLGGLYVLTGRLWAPISFHIAWNFSEGYIFGAQVSGVALGQSLYRAEPVAGVGTLWTGGMFGPEASLPALLLTTLAAAALLVTALRTHRLPAARLER
jgi:CAAX protease family protein